MTRMMTFHLNTQERHTDTHVVKVRSRGAEKLVEVSGLF